MISIKSIKRLLLF